MRDIALNDSHRTVRKAAVERIDDQPILEELARSPNPNIRLLSVYKLKNQRILGDIAQNDPVAEVRACAIDRVYDQSVISEIATADNTDSTVRKAAVRKLKDQKTLKAIVEKDPNKQVSAEAAARLKAIKSGK